ncbi:hypothetical protein GCM10023219_06380 [Stakelama sediminis]|uniref:Secreted protein with PEP-CTERM sorting signal n=1 Tax=Stakelama sediminis TaxID=463200 RepID=A0A840YUU8_9SPHN|nr:hypothetical protein [Stakelama sediminis]MBB5717356.1 hypothetical protein [Stakelama sediminis]
MRPLHPLLTALLLALPAHASVAPHSGLIDRTGFKPSDVALFIFAAVAIWFVRRSLRARFARRRDDTKD